MVITAPLQIIYESKKSTSSIFDIINDRTTYWKLLQYDHLRLPELRAKLKHRRIAFKANANTNMAMNLLRRADRGLLNYAVYETAELRGLIKSKGVVDKGRPKASHSELVRVLERADDTATFERFMELPPELRCMVYEAHFEDFTYLDAEAKPPPVCFVASIVGETMPLFEKRRSGCGTASERLRKFFRNREVV